MSNLEKYTAAFTSTFLVDESTLKDLKYKDILNGREGVLISIIHKQHCGCKTLLIAGNS